MSWNSSELVDKSNFSKLAESESHIRIYHSYGEKEINATKTSNKDINRIITELKLKNLEINFNPVKDANHHSVLSRAVYDGLLFVYQK